MTEPRVFITDPVEWCQRHLIHPDLPPEVQDRIRVSMDERDRREGVVYVGPGSERNPDAQA